MIIASICGFGGVHKVAVIAWGMCVCASVCGQSQRWNWKFPNDLTFNDIAMCFRSEIYRNRSEFQRVISDKRWDLVWIHRLMITFFRWSIFLLTFSESARWKSNVTFMRCCACPGLVARKTPNEFNTRLEHIKHDHKINFNELNSHRLRHFFHSLHNLRWHKTIRK